MKEKSLREAKLCKMSNTTKRIVYYKSNIDNADNFRM